VANGTRWHGGAAAGGAV